MLRVNSKPREIVVLRRHLTGPKTSSTHVRRGGCLVGADSPFPESGTFSDNAFSLRRDPESRLIDLDRVKRFLPANNELDIPPRPERARWVILLESAPTIRVPEKRTGIPVVKDGDKHCFLLQDISVDLPVEECPAVALLSEHWQ